MESIDIDLQLEQSSKESPFLSNAKTFAILQSFRNSPIVKERFTKYDIEKDKTLAH